MAIDPNLIDLYVKILKQGWKVGEYEVLDNGMLSIFIYDPTSSQEDREYWIKCGNDLGAMYRAPRGDKVSSYLFWNRHNEPRSI